MRLYRSLRHPAEGESWWDNWAHNFIVSLVLWPGLALVVLVVVALLLAH